MGRLRKKRWIVLGLVIGLLLLSLFLLWRWYGSMIPKTAETPLLTNTAAVNAVDPITPTPWVLTTPTVQIDVIPQADEQSPCTVTWLNESTPAELTFYTMNLAGERRNLNYTTEPCSLNENIDALTYVGVEADEEFIGGLQPPNLPYSSLMSLPDNPTTVYPTTGYWHYTMTAAPENLNCAVGNFGAVEAAGQVELVMSNYGFTGNFITDDASISLYRLQYQSTDYESPQYSFPLANGAYGEVQYQFTALDQEHMTGTLQVTGDQCMGEYPLTMELEIPTVPPLYIPGQGNWNISYGPIVCGTAVVSPALLNLPVGSANLTVTGGGPIPMNLFFAGTPSSLQLMQASDSNIYNSVPNLYLGTALDPVTALPFTLMGTFNVAAFSDTQLVGTLLLQGTNGCASASFVQFQQ